MIDTLQDPIIKTLLSTRKQITDISPEDELERQHRMYNMLRWSNKYKKLQVSQANSNWVSQNTIQIDGDPDQKRPDTGFVRKVLHSNEHKNNIGNTNELQGLSQVWSLSDETHTPSQAFDTNPQQIGTHTLNSNSITDSNATTFSTPLLNQHKCECLVKPCTRFTQIGKCETETIADLNFKDLVCTGDEYDGDLFKDIDSYCAFEELMTEEYESDGNEKKVRFDNMVNYIPGKECVSRKTRKAALIKFLKNVRAKFKST